MRYFVAKSNKTHSSQDGKKTLCGRKTANFKEGKGETDCAVCCARNNHSNIMSSRENDGLKVGSILYCGKNISSTGWVRIITDQSHPDAKGNVLQPGITDYDYIVVEHDHDRPHEIRPRFYITKKEAEKWQKQT